MASFQGEVVSVLLLEVALTHTTRVAWFVYTHTHTRMVIVTVCVTLVFVGVAFRSVLVPLRSVITIGITILFVFGFAALTYVVSWALHLPVRGCW